LTNMSCITNAEELVEKTEKLSVKEEKQQQILLEEINYNEGEILKAYEALMKEDPRCVCMCHGVCAAVWIVNACWVR